MKLFESTSKDKDCLKIYLQQMLSKKLAKRKLLNHEMEISALNHLIHIWGRNFIDPRGSQTLESTIRKVTDTYLLSLSIDSAPTHRAVAQGYIHLLESWIKQEYGLKISKIHELLVSSLEKAIWGGDDKVAQFGAAHWFYFLVRAANEKGYIELWKYLYHRYMNLFKVS